MLARWCTRLGKERGLGELVWAGSPRIGPLGGSERSWTLTTDGFAGSEPLTALRGQSRFCSP